MCIQISLICFYILKDYVGQSFEILPESNPSISLKNQSSTYNYGYWFKFQPLTKLKKQRRFGNSANQFYTESNQYLLSFEVSDKNTLYTLSLWHVQTDKFDHIINILQTDGMKSHLFRPDLLDYEGRWNFFGIQMISDNQYQIIFFMNQLEIKIINAKIQRKQQKDYYIGGYGNFQNPNGSQIQFQYFKGKLTNFIELDEIVTENNFEDNVLSDKQSYIATLFPIKEQYFNKLKLDGLSAKKYEYLSYREGIRYAISMWVKSSIKQYLQPLNYSIFRASLNDKLTDTHLGDNQLFIQYQIGLVPTDNIVYAMTYSFETPIYSFQKKSDRDWIKIQDQDLMQGLQQWHFIQFEYGRTSKPQASPPVYNSLLTLILPTMEKQFNQDWNRDNHHFTGVPMYFYLGGTLSQKENKFIGSISQFTFISFNTMDLQATIQCHYTCLTCSGPTSSDCLTCSEEKNRVLSLNQCDCQMGYMNKAPALIDSECELPSQKYQMIEFVETEYKCPEGYDQCEDKVVCSFGYFREYETCYKCPQQPLEQLQDVIFCAECVLNPKSWGYWDLSCRSNFLKLDSTTFSRNYRDVFLYQYQKNGDTLEMNSIEYIYSEECENEYGFEFELDFNLESCKKCQNCLKCEYQEDIQICLECPRSYYLHKKNCIECGINCEKCDLNGCLVCKEGWFLTLDKINCNECQIQDCAYCYQYYQNQTSNQITLSLDLKFNQLDISLDGIKTSCARCNDGFAIEGDSCIEYSMQSCLTGIMDNDQFKCLIAWDQSTGLQFDNCDLVENCYSCFVNYPIEPWCIQCLDGYYVLSEVGSCIACPDKCASCFRQNSAFKDFWKTNIRAFYYYKFGSHLFEDYAIDSDNYQYNIVCTACKDDYIIYENTCIPGCGQDCEVCEAKKSKAVCVKCKDNLYGPVLSLDENSLCLQCPQNCQACTPRDAIDIKDLNKYFNQQITSNERKCYLQEKGYFMDNEFNLPVKCENSQKCFKSLILKLDVYCDTEFIENITICDIFDIQQCLLDIFNQEMIDNMKKQVIKELEIILEIQDQQCKTDEIIITQFMDMHVISLKKTTLKLISKNQTDLSLNMIYLKNFSNYFISNITLKSFKVFKIKGFQQNINFQQLIIQPKYSGRFIFNNVQNLILKDVIFKEYYKREKNLFSIQNQDMRSISVLIIGLQIINQNDPGPFFEITSQKVGQIDLILTNISIVNSVFSNKSQFIVSNSQQIKAVIQNLTIENNIFQDCQFLKFENVDEQPQFQVSVKNNTLKNSILIQIPLINIENSSFLRNKLSSSSILIKSIGSFSNFSGQFIFQHLLIQQNEYCYGCQFISINNQYQKNISVYFKNYSSINNQQGDFLNMELNQQSLIYINTNYVFINTFFIERLNGTIELSIIQSQIIEMQNLTIQNNQIYKIITKQLKCLSNSQNLFVYILDTQYISIDKFIINQISAIDYSIIAIQSQSILKKQQNETIILKNGQIFNNSLVVSQLNKQISVIQINSQQKQQIYINDLKFVKNILDVYVQDQQMFSASTLLIQSEKGQVYLQNLNFQQNFVINSINSQLRIQSNFIQIRDTIFIQNNIFNLEVLKNFLILNYYDLIYIETIQFDFPIVSNGGSGQFIASTIIIDNINIQGSFGANGGAFFIQTLGESNIKISNFFSIQSFVLPDTTSQGGTFYIDGSKSNLQLIIENVSIQDSKSRKNGGFIYLNALQMISEINNVSCTNCFSINGGFIIVNSTEFYPPQITLKNIKIQNPDFRWFLGNLNDMTIEEQIIFRKNSYLLYLPNSILKVYQLQITDGDLSGILYVDGKNGIIIDKMIIQQYRAFLTPLVTISHSQITQKQIYLADIQIKGINYGSSKQYVCNNGLYEVQMEPFNTQENCSKEELIKIQEIFTLFDDHYIENTFNCNYENIHQNSEEAVAIIQVFNLSKNVINIENIYINNISYNSTYGLFSLRDFSQIANQVKINNLNIINSNCGNGCMLVSSSTSDLTNKKRLLVNNMYEIIKSSNSSVNIYNSKFINNKAIQGSGIYIQNVTVMIINTVFINNKAQTQGGAVYSSSIISNLLLLNNQIINNNGANQTGSAVQLNNFTMSKLDGFQNIFFDNQQDLNEIPQGLQILIGNVILRKNTIKNDSQVLIEEVYVKPYKLLGYKQLTDVIALPSGQSIKYYKYFDQFSQSYIPYNLSLRFILINRFRQQQYDQQIDLQLTARTNNSNYSNKYFNQDVFVYDNTTQSFNLDDLIIYYSPYESNNLEVRLQSSGIKIPQYSSTPPYNIESYQNYELRFVIKTFQCQLGQFYNVIIQSCEQCSGNTYSVQLNSRICVFKDDNLLNEVNSAMIQLKPGYWRAYVFSPQIDSCYHLKENCIGGWGTGNQLCTQGHIGALCEQCDLYNIRGNGQQQVSSLYSCGSCSAVTGNIISIILISLWTLISTIMSVKSTIDHVRKAKLINIGLTLPDQKINPAIVIKVLSNYLQIIFAMTTFQLKVPPGIYSVFNAAGNPMSQMAYSLDCFLTDLTKINIIYFRIIWSLVISFSYILIYQSGYFILVITKKSIFNISAVTTCFIYLYVYLQPNLISSLMQLVSYRYISGQSWISGNVSYRYDTKTHTIWLISFVMPLLLVIGLIIPTFLLFGLFKNRKNLNDNKIKSIWGYLYNEYTQSSYYWETIKITQKEFIIIVLAYYEDYIPIKAALVFICLFFYSQFTNIKKPYKQGVFNQIDAQQTTICAVSIILATTIYTAQQYKLFEIIWPFYLIIAQLNCYFVIKLLGILIYAYGQAFETKLDQIRDIITFKYPELINKNGFLKKILENQQSRKIRIHQKFKKIKKYLIPKAQLIIQFKKQNKMITQSKPQKPTYILQTQLNDSIESPFNRNTSLIIE